MDLGDCTGQVIDDNGLVCPQRGQQFSLIERAPDGYPFRPLGHIYHAEGRTWVKGLLDDDQPSA